MNPLKDIGVAIVKLVKQTWLLPTTISNSIKHRQQQQIVNEHETERLDRIRNPHKYRGK
jgi:hypothetical protein